MTRDDIGMLMFAPDPKTKGYIDNVGLFKYLGMQPVESSDFKNYVDNLGTYDDKFLKCIDYLGMQSNIEIVDLSKWLDQTKSVVAAASEACGYEFKSEAEKKLAEYSLTFRTFAFFEDYSKIGDAIDNDTANEILNIVVDSDLRVFLMYYFVVPYLEYMRTADVRNAHLYITAMKVAMSIQSKFDVVDKNMIHVDERGYLIND